MYVNSVNMCKCRINYRHINVYDTALFMVHRDSGADIRRYRSRFRYDTDDVEDKDVEEVKQRSQTTQLIE